jgi:hypothetical protein
MTKLTVAFPSIANAPKNWLLKNILFVGPFGLFVRMFTVLQGAEFGCFGCGNGVLHY